jgi:hypothetical protein
MKTQAMATVENGQLTLDEPPDLPDRNSRFNRFRMLGAIR